MILGFIRLKVKQNTFLPENSFLNLLYIKPDATDKGKPPSNV